MFEGWKFALSDCENLLYRFGIRVEHSKSQPRDCSKIGIYSTCHQTQRSGKRYDLPSTLILMEPDQLHTLVSAQ